MNWNGTDQLGDVGIDRVIILIWILIRCGVADWTNVAQGRDQPQAVVNTNLNKVKTEPTGCN
jgi:hypothetical protein